MNNDGRYFASTVDSLDDEDTYGGFPRDDAYDAWIRERGEEMELRGGCSYEEFRENYRLTNAVTWDEDDA